MTSTSSYPPAVEQYGSVSFSTEGGVRRRRGRVGSERASRDRDANPNRNRADADADADIRRETSSHPYPDSISISTSFQVFQYKHNAATAILLLPPLLSMYCSQHSPMPLVVSLYAILVLYALDLCASEIVPFGIWIAFGIIFISFICEHYSWNDDDGWGWLAWFSEVVILFCLGCWATLQNEWLSCDDAEDYGMAMERMLHTLLPLGSAFVISHLTTVHWLGGGDPDRIHCELCPYIFAAVLCYGMVTLGQSTSSFPRKQPQPDHNDSSTSRNRQQTSAPQRNRNEENKYAKTKRRRRSIKNDERALNESDGRLLSYFLLCIPTTMHIMGKYRLTSSSSSTVVTASKEFAAVMLIMSTSHSLHWILGQRGLLWWWQGKEHIRIPRQFNFIMDWQFLASVMVTLFSFEYRYLIPITEAISHELHGRVTKSSWLVCLYFTAGVICMAASALFYGKRNSDGQPLGGDRHDDFFQIMALGSMIMIGMAFPLPFEVISLLAAALITMGLFAYTKLLRYMFIATFVNVAGILSIFSFQLKFVRHDMWIVPRYFKVEIFGFYTILVGLGVLIMFVYGLIVRGEGGKFQRSFDSIDLSGLLLIGYSMILTIVEASLHHDCSTISDEKRNPYQECEYPEEFILLTSTVLILLSMGLLRIDAMKRFSSSVVMAVSLGKAIAVLVQSEQDGPQMEHSIFLINTAIVSFFILVIRLPYVALKPIPLKGGQNISTKKKGQSLRHASTVINAYCAFVLPVSIFLAIPAIITPAITYLRGYSGYHQTRPQSSETIGCFIAVWGLSALCLIRHFLPDGGVFGWRKFSFGASIFGMVLMITAPGNPFATSIGHNSNFSFLSSIGAAGSWQEIKGAWGLVFASLALIMTLGPLRFDVKKGVRSSEFVILRVTIFSILFGCGLSWFLASQMAQTFTRPQMILALTSSVITSFLFTLSATLCHTVNDRDFDNAATVTKFSISTSSYLIFSGVIIELFRKRSFVVSGTWYTTLLATSSFFLFLISAATRLRVGRTKKTRSLGNKCAMISWSSAIFAIYGSFGIASADVESEWKYFLRFPSSVILTIAASLLLSTVQPESSGRNTRHARFRERSGNSRRRLPSLVYGSDSYSIPLLLTIVVFVVITYYAILIRGLTGKVHLSHTDALLSGKEQNSGALFTLVRGYEANHSKSIAFSSKLAACSIWTAKSFIGPIKHLLCLIVGPTFTCYLFYYYLFPEGSMPTSSSFSLAAVLNSSTLILCKGIPSLSAAAFLGILAAVRCMFVRKSTEWRSRMSI